MVDAILVYSPEKELEILSSLARDGTKVDWKPAIILAATYLEKFGVERLRRYSKEKTIKLGKELEGLSLYHVTTFLYGLGLIEDKDFSQMTQIRVERNRCMHACKYVGRWFDYLMVSKEEMKEILKGTGWKVKKFIDSEDSLYIAIIEKKT